MMKCKNNDVTNSTSKILQMIKTTEECDRICCMYLNIYGWTITQLNVTSWLNDQIINQYYTILSAR